MENFKETKHWLNNEIVALEVACLMKALVLSFIGPGIFQGGFLGNCKNMHFALCPPASCLNGKGKRPLFFYGLLGKILPAGDKITA